MSICLHDVSFAYRQDTLVNDVSTEFAAGQVSIIVGPNGAGKTTLLKLISGELKCGAGNISYHGRKLTDMSLLEQALARAVMTQASHIVFDFLVKDILAMGWVRPNQGMMKTQMQAVIEQCHIADYLHRPFNSLSGGEQQRVQFARALLQVCPMAPLTQPAFLLLDEPTSSLDVAHELMLLELVQDAAAQGIGVIIVMHDLNLASRYADNIYLLCKGALIASGSPGEVLEGPRLSGVYGTPLTVEHHGGLNRLMVYAQ